jgi:hypothetical protein
MNPPARSIGHSLPAHKHLRICPVTGRVLVPAPERRWPVWLGSGMGLVSLLWFLIRVIPKPSRAAYPCQRIAFPLASSFITWLVLVLGSAFAWRKRYARLAPLWRTFLWTAAAVIGTGLAIAYFPAVRAIAGPNPPHGPLGIAKGIFPGRVAWVYAPQATSWAGFTSPEPWWQTNHTDLAVVQEMLSKAVCAVGGGGSDAAAWDAIFRYFNQNHGKGARGYQAGEKIAIKINLTTCNARGGTYYVDTSTTYEKQTHGTDHWMNTIDNSPQMLLTLLRHLVYTVGVSQTNISLGDPTGNFPQYMWNMLHPEFPQVTYFDNYGGQGRVRTTFSSVPFYWSVTNADFTKPAVQDYIPVPFAQADYLIDFAVLKGHSVGVTFCGKNLYGALLRCPDGYYRDANGLNQGAVLNYSSMHASTPDPGMSTAQGLGHYRAIVDLMGHPALGGKILLCLVDGLYGGYFWDSHPYKWNMPPFNGNWPSSLFASQDPVAIDSVCYDFLLTEWPNVVNNRSASPGNRLQGGAEDYLHEMAQADSPASGTFYDPAKTGTHLASLGMHEHWNNPTSKQYSRNLGTGQGIELVALTAKRPDPILSISRSGGQSVISWQGSLTGFHLQAATNLADSAPWSDISTLPVIVQGRNTITNQTLLPNNFYRLIK